MNQLKEFSIIVALDKEQGIGKDGGLPWNISADLKHFKKITTKVSSEGKKNAVIMGRKTWESIPQRFRPLKNRINVVLTRNESLIFPQDVVNAKDFDDAFYILGEKIFNSLENIFVIGGEQLFNEAIKQPQCKNIYITHIEKTFDCDTFFPQFKDKFKKRLESRKFGNPTLSYYFTEYQRK